MLSSLALFLVLCALAILRCGSQLQGLVEPQNVQVSALPSQRVPVGCTSPGTMSLVFNDGPTPSRTRLVLNILWRRGLKAAFHINVDKLDDIESRYLVSRMLQEGHVIGLQYPGLNPVPSKDPQAVEKLAVKLLTAMAKVRRVAGVWPRFLQMYYLGYASQVRAAAALLKLVPTSRFEFSEIAKCDDANGISIMCANFYSLSTTPDDSYIVRHLDPCQISTGVAVSLNIAVSRGFRIIPINECRDIKQIYLTDDQVSKIVAQNKFLSEVNLNLEMPSN